MIWLIFFSIGAITATVLLINEIESAHDNDPDEE
tara:strand:- start:11290 stop:11391 length:102 start_codon:yes stop_codon:yes gene_type:complete